jgi:hypothetical protein
MPNLWAIKARASGVVPVGWCFRLPNAPAIARRLKAGRSTVQHSVLLVLHTVPFVSCGLGNFGYVLGQNGSLLPAAQVDSVLHRRDDAVGQRSHLGAQLSSRVP